MLSFFRLCYKVEKQIQENSHVIESLLDSSLNLQSEQFTDISFSDISLLVDTVNMDSSYNILPNILEVVAAMREGPSIPVLIGDDITETVLTKVSTIVKENIDTAIDTTIDMYQEEQPLIDVSASLHESAMN